MSDNNFNMFNQEWLNKMLNPKDMEAPLKSDKNFQNANLQSQESFSNFYRDWMKDQDGGSFNPEQPIEPAVLNRMSSSASDETAQKIIQMHQPENPFESMKMEVPKGEPTDLSKQIPGLPLEQLMEVGKNLFSQLIDQKEFQDYMIQAMIACDDFYQSFKKAMMEQMFKQMK